MKLGWTEILKRGKMLRGRDLESIYWISTLYKRPSKLLLFIVYTSKNEEEPLCSDYTWALEANTLPFYDLDQLFNLFKSDLYNKLLFLAFKTLFI